MKLPEKKEIYFELVGIAMGAHASCRRFVHYEMGIKIADTLRKCGVKIECLKDRTRYYNQDGEILQEYELDYKVGANEIF